MKIPKKKQIIFLIFPLLFSCEKEVDWLVDNSLGRQVVIESVLTNENKIQELRLSYSKRLARDKTLGISGATVRITNGQNNFTFLESDSITGLYLSTIPFTASISKEYKLKVEIETHTYTAMTKMVSIAPMQKLQYDSYSIPDYYKISSVAPLFNPEEQSLYEIRISGDTIITSVDTTNLAKVFYYTFNTIDIGEVFAPNKDEIIFKKGSWIIERKYSMTDEYASFIKAMASETDWQGGFLSEKPANIPTNIEGGAIGFFTACTVLTDSISVD